MCMREQRFMLSWHTEAERVASVALKAELSRSILPEYKYM